MSALFGIDLGGTKIEGVVLPNRDDPEPLARIRTDTVADKGYGHILERISELIKQLSKETGIHPDRIGIGTPGSTNPHTGLLRNSNTTCLNGMPFHRDLETELGVKVAMSNDANCFALAEARWGVAQEFSTVFGVIIGTGVGGGLVIHGRVLEGANGIAGEWGHNEFDTNGPECYCGKRGCVETFLSGPANEREYFQTTGLRKSMKEIVESVGSERAAKEQVDRLCVRFGKATSVVINTFDPEAIVLGGGVGQIPGLLTQGRDEAARWVFSDRFETAFLTPTLGASAGVFGAALLAAGTPQS